MSYAPHLADNVDHPEPEPLPESLKLENMPTEDDETTPSKPAPSKPAALSTSTPSQSTPATSTASKPSTTSTASASAPAPSTLAAAPSSAPKSVSSSSAPAPSAALDSIAGGGSDILTKAQETAAPYIKSAQDAAAPYLEKGKAIAGDVVQKAGETYEAAKARADAEIAKQRGVAADAKEQTAKAADDFAAEASRKTDAAAKEGGANLESAQTYLAGLAQNVTETLTNLTHKLDDSTATASHPGVVTQASSLISSAAEFVQAHLPATTGEAVQKTEATGTAVADAARSKADEAEITDALRELAQGGKQSLTNAEGTVIGEVKRP